LFFADGAGGHAAAAEADLCAASDRGGEHFLAVALGERVGEPQPVVGAFGSVCGVIEEDEGLHVA
jgi:hypothetical protein